MTEWLNWTEVIFYHAAQITSISTENKKVSEAISSIIDKLNKFLNFSIFIKLRFLKNFNFYKIWDILLKETKTLKMPFLKTYQESLWNPHISKNSMSRKRESHSVFLFYFFSASLHVLSHCYFPLHACCCFSCVWFFVTLWTIACQDPLPMGFSRKEYWSGLPYPPPGDLPDPGIKPASLVVPALQAGSLPVVCQIVNDLTYLRISN